MKTNGQRFFSGVVLLLVFSVLAGAAPAGASDITLFGGVQNPSEFTVDTVTSAVTINPANFGVFGVRFTTSGAIGTEQTLAYSPNFISSEDSAIIYNSNLVLQAPLPRVRPYGTVGIGTVYIRTSSGGLLSAIDGAKFAFNYGGGLKVALSGPAGLQFDARGYSIRGIQNDSMRVLEVSVGLLFSF